MPRKVTLVKGQRNDRLILVEYIEERPHTKVRVLCDCGVEKTIRATNFRKTSSCGCLFLEVAGKTSITHGMSKTDTYQCWRDMKLRCTDPTNKRYAEYGGRGITVCDSWLHSFENFLAYMGVRPDRKHTVGRINNNGPYAPGNTRWETLVEQGNNRRNNVNLTYLGRTQSLTSWAREFGLDYYFVRNRIKRGWTLAQSLTIPAITQEQRNLPGYVAVICR